MFGAQEAGCAGYVEEVALGELIRADEFEGSLRAKEDADGAGRS
jgi:hypothetical protein